MIYWQERPLEANDLVCPPASQPRSFMSYVARSQLQEADWKLVSKKHPCPICKAADGCHRDLAGDFACCANRRSDWPLTSGAWLHRVEAAEQSVVGAHVAVLASRAEHPTAAVRCPV
jgi:hypothetical protein